MRRCSHGRRAEEGPPQAAEELLARYGAGERDFGNEEVEAATADMRNHRANEYLRRARLVEAMAPGAERQRARLANLANARLAGANLAGVTLEGADLKAADLRGAQLQGANLRGADLTGARLDLEDHLDAAYRTSAHLEGAKLNSATLNGAILRSAYLQNADIREASLEGADLSFANLRGANLRDVRLNEAILLHSRGVRLDHTFVRNAQFSPASAWPFGPDDWTQLRQKYTGTAMMFNLILLFAFLVPLVAKVFFWTGVNQAQDRVATGLQPVRAKVEILGALAADASLAPRTRAALDDLRSIVANENWTLCLHAECVRRPVWKVMLETDKEPASWGLGLLLILYNIGRAILTKFVGPLREQEERSGWTPERNFRFRSLVGLHYLVWALGWVALAAVVYHGVDWLMATVSVPV